MESLLAPHRRLAALHKQRNEQVTAEVPVPRLRQPMGSIIPGAPNSCQAQDERSSCYLGESRVHLRVNMIWLTGELFSIIVMQKSIPKIYCHSMIARKECLNPPSLLRMVLAA